MAMSAVVPIGSGSVRSKRARKVIVITSNKGGVGKSTLAFSIAVAAAYEGLNVCIVDLDAQHGTEFLCQVRRKKIPYAPQIDVFAHDLSQAEYALSRTEEYDLVIVDSPPGVEKHEGPVKLLVDRADFVLVPTGSGILDMRACVQWLEKLKPLKARQLAFVLNKTKPNTNAFRMASDFISERGRVCDTDVRSLQVIEDEQKSGRTVFDILSSVGDMTPKKAEKAIDQARDLKKVWNYLRAEAGL